MVSTIEPQQADWPDFVALYPVHRSAAGELESFMTPRTACWLWVAASDLADEWHDLALFAADGFSDLDLSDLPPIARLHAEPVWLDRFAGCFTTIARRLATADCWPLPRCTGDELAVHLIIRYLKDLLPTDELALPDDFEEYPHVEEIDDDLELVREILVEDTDVLLLYNKALDGIEHEQNQLRLVNLHPTKWFLTFPNCEE